jgi:fatty-acyl-CoA synthase
LAAGGEVLIPTAAGFRNPEVVAGHWRMVEHFQPTIIGGIPTSLGALLDVPTNGADLSSVRLCITGGALLPRALGVAFSERFGMPVRQIYGMTECAGLIAASDTHYDPLVGAIGHTPPGVEIGARRILSNDTLGDSVRPGEPGVLVVRGPNVFPGYLGGSPFPFTEDGWLVTGDVGSVGIDGLVRVTGRFKDLIIRSGHNIDPVVIEDAAAEHPYVVASAAVGRPDAYAGETPMLYVVLRKETPEILADLGDHMQRSVPEPPARPKTIVSIPSLPLTGPGKVDKQSLRRDAAVRAAKEALDAMPTFAGSSARVDARDGPGGRIVVVVTLTNPASTGEDPAALIARNLSRFQFDHEVLVREQDAVS